MQGLENAILEEMFQLNLIQKVPESKQSSYP